MTKLAKNRKALSQPVTTMILLVIPVMLTGGVVMHAYQIIGTEVELELLVLSNQHIWVYNNGTSFAAIEIGNMSAEEALL